MSNKRYVRINDIKIEDTVTNKQYYTNNEDGAGGWNILNVVNGQNDELEILRKQSKDYADLIRENHHLKQKLLLIENNIKFPDNATDEKLYYVNSAGHLCNMDLNNTLNIFECADLLNKFNYENTQLKSELVDCKALILMLSDTTISGRVDNIIYNRYSFKNENEYYAELEKYKEKVKEELEK